MTIINPLARFGVIATVDSPALSQEIKNNILFAIEAESISLGGLKESLYRQPVTDLYVQLRSQGMLEQDARIAINNWIGGVLVEQEERASSTAFIGTRVIASALVGGAAIAAVGATTVSVAGLVIDKELQDTEIKKAAGLQEFFNQTEELSLLEPEIVDVPLEIKKEEEGKDFLTLGLTALGAFFAFK